jgi:hypothetical protein
MRSNRALGIGFFFVLACFEPAKADPFFHHGIEQRYPNDGITWRTPLPGFDPETGTPTYKHLTTIGNARAADCLVAVPDDISKSFARGQLDAEAQTIFDEQKLWG